MWIVGGLLIFAAWTAVGFVAALLFFRLGFGFGSRESDAELAPQVPQPERERRVAADRRYALAPADSTARRRFADDVSREEAPARARLERREPVKAVG